MSCFDYKGFLLWFVLFKFRSGNPVQTQIQTQQWLYCLVSAWLSVSCPPFCIVVSIMTWWLFFMFIWMFIYSSFFKSCVCLVLSFCFFLGFFLVAPLFLWIIAFLVWVSCTSCVYASPHLVDYPHQSHLTPATSPQFVSNWIWCTCLQLPLLPFSRHTSPPVSLPDSPVWALQNLCLLGVFTAGLWFYNLAATLNSNSVSAIFPHKNSMFLLVKGA